MQKCVLDSCPIIFEIIMPLLCTYNYCYQCRFVKKMIWKCLFSIFNVPNTDQFTDVIRIIIILKTVLNLPKSLLENDFRKFFFFSFNQLDLLRFRLLIGIKLKMWNGRFRVPTLYMLNSNKFTEYLLHH